MISRATADRRARAVRKLIVGLAAVTAVSGATMSAGVAAAATTAVLYVDPAGTTTSCTAPGAGACPTLQDAVTAASASTYNGYAVTVDIAPGTYTGTTVVDDPSVGSLVLQGSSPAASIL